MSRSAKKLAVVFAASLLLLLNGCWWSSFLTGSKALKLAPDAGTPHRPIYHQGDWTIARASLHNHTIISDGKYRPEDLVELARRTGISVLAITDHREGGIKVDGLKIPVNGIEKIGYDEYFKRLLLLKRSAEANQDMILLIGAEVNPYIFNAGKYPNLVIMNQNYHFVVYRVSDPQVYKKMPVWKEVSFKPLTYPGLAPYQKWIDYMVEHGALVTAAHPASDESYQILNILIYGDAPVNNIRLQNLAAYASLRESFGPEISEAGGAWDSVLSEYLAGMRARPLWTVGDADYHGDEGSLANATTLFYMKEWSEAEVYRCLQEGRMVALAGPMFQNSYVAEFSASDQAAPENEIMFGREIKVSSPPVIRFRLDHEIPGVKTRLIRNGRVIKEFQGSSLEYTDREMLEGKTPAFYRIEVRGRDEPETKDTPFLYQRVNILFTNPVIVRFE